MIKNPLPTGFQMEADTLPMVLFSHKLRVPTGSVTIRFLPLPPMLTISNRGQQMPPSPIRKLVPFAEAAKKKGIKVYHLNIGQPDIETPPAILDAVRNADIKVLEYSHSAGNESYRRKLVQYYKSVGIDVSYDQIMITTGGS